MTVKLIIPPSEIRLIIEKLAAYVVKNGPSFEDKILEKERLNPRFSFLFPTDPYHAYYQKLLQEYYEAGPEGVDVLLAQSTGSETAIPPAAPLEKTIPSSVSSKPMMVSPIIASQPPSPSPLDFIIEFPPETIINALDYDVIKLTAQYVARNGRPFLMALSQREADNAQFAFLLPHHSWHQIFLRLVDQYQRIYPPSEAQRQKLLQMSSKEGRVMLLEACLQRARYRKWAGEEELKKAEEEEREKIEFNSIDWNDFAVVETLDFGAQDRAGLNPLPPPTTISSIRGLSLVQRKELWTGNYTGLLGRRDRMTSAISPPLSSSIATMTGIVQNQADMQADALPPSLSSSMKWPSHLSIRADYIPKAVATTSGSSSSSLAANIIPASPGIDTEICPICNQAIAKGHIADHIRIESLDPRWKEQRERYLAKHRDTNYVTSASDVVGSLQAMNKVRSELANLDEQERERILKEANRQTMQRTVLWDGRVESVPQVTRQAMRLAKPILAAQMQQLVTPPNDSANVNDHAVESNDRPTPQRRRID